jgi:uncharacterized membrane protein YhiD involved in acid resistance
MDWFWHLLETTEAGGLSPTIETILLSLLLAFVLGQLLAWAYCWTHSGLSYSRSFTQSLLLITMVVSLVMIVIGNNIITAFGLIGALAIIRFRNVLKDTRDTVFIFLALVQGMAVGSQRHATAIVGTLVLLLVLFYIHWTDFGSRGHFDGFLRFRAPINPDESGDFAAVLRRHCRASRQLSVQQMTHEQFAHCAYQIRLRDPDDSNLLITDLKEIKGIEDVSLVLQEEPAEV